MPGYYANSLSAERLERCYQLATPRVQQYLKAEIDHVIERVTGVALILELGCGYGRVLSALSLHVGRAIGIDTSEKSLLYGQNLYAKQKACSFVCADAARLPFSDDTFDAVLCVQNGISAFKVDQKQLVRESLRVCRQTGLTLFSTYARKFWNYRLEWFRAQADAGLIGPIDEERTRDGIITCIDGFVATTPSPGDFVALASTCDAEAVTYEIDESSLFCSIPKRA